MMEKHRAPGKSDRIGISLLQFTEMFPNEEAAVKWFEAVHWPEQRRCGHCKGTNTKVVKSGRPMPYHCGDCRKYFSVRTGTVIQCSNLPMLKRAHKGTFHRLSRKHLGRYIAEFSKRHNIREKDTIAQMVDMVASTVGRRLLYRELVEDNGLDPTAVT